MNEEIHDRFYDDIDGNKHFNSTQLVERYRCEGNGALCDMDCENCEFYKKCYTKEPCPYCHGKKDLLKKVNGFGVYIYENNLGLYFECSEGEADDDVKINYCPMCGRKFEDVCRVE